MPFGNTPLAHAPEPPARDRVGSRGLRPVTLPHHRTCGFPHPAVAPRGVKAPQAAIGGRPFPWQLMHRFPSRGSRRLRRWLRCFGLATAAPLLSSAAGGVVAAVAASRRFRRLLCRLPSVPRLVLHLMVFGLRPFAPSGFHRLSSLLRPLLTAAPLSRCSSPRVRT